MARPAKQTPIAVFEENIDDAGRLLLLSEALLNQRVRKMRVEPRSAVGDALRVPTGKRAHLDCCESNDLFVVLLPGGRLTRDHFGDSGLRPLLRQAVVAVSAAVETYVADKACCYISDALKDPPPRLKEVPLTLVGAMEVDAAYSRRRWGYRKVLENYLREVASPAPSSVGKVFSVVGRKVDWKKLDGSRGVKHGSTENDLAALYGRRNRVAHSGDRSGSGKAQIKLDEVQGFVQSARSIVETLDKQLDNAPRPA